MPADQQLLFIEHVLPVKCFKIRYFDDPIFKERLLPAPGVKKHDVSKYSGGRMDDHFAMWQERVHREGAVSAPRAPVASASPRSEPARHAPATAAEFSLDFSDVRIPVGRYLTEPEVTAAVHSFLDELETA